MHRPRPPSSSARHCDAARQTSECKQWLLPPICLSCAVKEPPGKRQIQPNESAIPHKADPKHRPKNITERQTRLACVSREAKQMPTIHHARPHLGGQHSARRAAGGLASGDRGRDASHGICVDAKGRCRHLRCRRHQARIPAAPPTPFPPAAALAAHARGGLLLKLAAARIWQAAARRGGGAPSPARPGASIGHS